MKNCVPSLHFVSWNVQLMIEVRHTHSDVSSGHMGEVGTTLYAQKLRTPSKESLKAVRCTIFRRCHDYNDRLELLHVYYASVHARLIHFDFFALVFHVSMRFYGIYHCLWTVCYLRNSFTERTFEYCWSQMSCEKLQKVILHFKTKQLFCPHCYGSFNRVSAPVCQNIWKWL